MSGKRDERFDMGEFLKRFDRCANDADGRVCAKVAAAPLAQAGGTALVGRCPCGEVAALSGEGRHMCRRCGRWLRYVREG